MEHHYERILMKSMTKKKRILIVAGIITIIFLYGCFTVYFKIGIPCMLHEFTGLYCPGCGLGRSIRCLIAGEWYQAFRYNVLLMPLSIPGTLLLLYTAWQYIKGTSYKEYVIVRIVERAGIPIALILMLYGILRNIPLFSILAPITIH